MKRISLCLAALLALLPAPAAHAGSYHVYTCSVNGRVFPNGAWTTTGDAGVTVDNSCSGGSIGLSVPAGASTPNGSAAALTFTSPPGTTILDFTLTRQLGFNDPAKDKTHKYFALYSLGGAHFAGAGNYADPVRNALHAQKQWYGYPQANTAIARSAAPRSMFPALAGYGGDATQLFLRVGCFDRGSPCTVDNGGGIANTLWGSDITINDPTPPAVTVEASGLLSGGARSGSDPITFDATDGAGIRSAQIVDVTGAPSVVGAEDYTTTPTDKRKLCNFAQPAPCPNLSHETIRPTSLGAGARSLELQVTDAGGNTVTRGPYQVFAETPSDRGAANGTNVTDTGAIQVNFNVHDETHRTLGYDEHAGVHGRLLNSSGAGIGGATLQVLSRDLRKDAGVVARGTITTAPDGTFTTTLASTASRLYEFAWLSHANDSRFAANGYLTLQARASAHLSTSTRHPSLGHAVTLSGQLRGVSRGKVTVLLQGRAAGSHHYDTFTDTTTTSDGHFRAHYTFRSSSSHGHAFVFRARIRPAASFPYETGYSNSVSVRVR